MKDTSAANRRLPVRILFPRLQSRLFTLVLAGIGTSLLVHTLVSVTSLTRAARELPNDGDALHSMIVALLVRDFVLAFALTVPAFALLGMAAFMRVLGPLHCMRMFLEKALRGQHPEPCRLREDDELQDICALLNRATEPLRARAAAEDVKRAA
jgi:hypothetical protein